MWDVVGSLGALSLGVFCLGALSLSEVLGSLGGAKHSDVRFRIERPRACAQNELQPYVL